MISAITGASTFTRIVFINPVFTYIITFLPIQLLTLRFFINQLIITQLLFIQSSLFLRYDFFINPVSTYTMIFIYLASTYAMGFYKSSFHLSYT